MKAAWFLMLVSAIRLGSCPTRSGRAARLPIPRRRDRNAGEELAGEGYDRLDPNQAGKARQHEACGTEWPVR